MAVLFGVARLGAGCQQIAGLSSPDTDPSKQHCVDGVRDDDEQDIDCGGKDCLACANAACTSDADCQSDGCVSGKCRVPICSDGVFDGYESALDCGDPRGGDADGGVVCPGCMDGIPCFNGCNCASSYCDPSSNNCAESPTGVPNCDRCKDGVKDAFESDVDCGGSTCPGCAKGKTCGVAADCASMVCNAGVCG